MTIKEVSEKTGLSINTLRYYERTGVMPKVPRNASGIRNYNDESLNWIDIIICFKRSGVGLESIREYVQLTLEGEEAKPARDRLLLEIKGHLEAKMAEIQESLDIINNKPDTYN